MPKGKAAREPADVARPPAQGFADAQASSVARGVPSVREAKELRAAEETAKNEEARVWFEKGISAAEAGNPGAARVYYRMAARRATGDLKREILERLECLHPSNSSRP